MRKAITSLILLAALFPSATLRAQQTATENLSSVEPFINNQTFAVCRIDLSRIDFSQLMQQLVDPLLQNDAQRATATALRDKLGQLNQKLQQEGVRYAYLVGSIQFWQPNYSKQETTRHPFGPLDQFCFIVVPGMQGNSRSHLQIMLNDLQMPASEGYRMFKTGLRLRETKSGTIVSSEEMIDEWASIESQPRPEFEAALAAAGDQPVCLALAPTPVMAKAAEEILREPLPPATQPIGPILAKGFRWAGIGVQPNLEQFSANLTIQSTNAEAALQLENTIRQFATTELVKQFTESPPQDSVMANGIVFVPLLLTMPEVKGDQLVLSFSGNRAQEFATFAQRAFKHGMASTWRLQSMNTMKQIALGILNYEDTHREMPDRAIRDKNGKPLLSWRVAILPWLEEAPLYKEFHLDEPWDSEHNRKLIERLPIVYSSPDTADSQSGRTRYVAVVGEHCIFPPDRAIKMKEISDGTSKTILVVEAEPDHAVIWTKPDDLEVDLDNPTRGLAGEHQTFNAVFADGHVEAIEGSIDPKTLRAMFTRDGEEEIKR